MRLWCVDRVGYVYPSVPNGSTGRPLRDENVADAGLCMAMPVAVFYAVASVYL